MANYIFELKIKEEPASASNFDMHHDHCVSCVRLKCKSVHSSCPVISCPNDCGMMYHKCKHDEHLKLCCNMKVPCINNFFGCPILLPRSQLGIHLSACPASIVCCTMEWNRWPVYSKERREKIPFNQTNLHARYGQLDVALALRDQRVLNAAMKAPLRRQRALRNSLTKRFPAVPFADVSDVEKYYDSETINDPSLNYSDDDSDAPWHVAKNPPGLQRSIYSGLFRATRQAADSLSAALSFLMASASESNNTDLLSKENMNPVINLDDGLINAENSNIYVDQVEHMKESSVSEDLQLSKMSLSNNDNSNSISEVASDNFISNYNDSGHYSIYNKSTTECVNSAVQPKILNTTNSLKKNMCSVLDYVHFSENFATKNEESKENTKSNTNENSCSCAHNQQQFNESSGTQDYKCDGKNKSTFMLINYNQKSGCNCPKTKCLYDMGSEIDKCEPIKLTEMHSSPYDVALNVCDGADMDSTGLNNILKVKKFDDNKQNEHDEEQRGSNSVRGTSKVMLDLDISVNVCENEYREQLKKNLEDNKIEVISSATDKSGKFDNFHLHNINGALYETEKINQTVNCSAVVDDYKSNNETVNEAMPEIHIVKEQRSDICYVTKIPPPPQALKLQNLLGLDLNLELLPCYQSKPRPMYTFRCGQVFRRTEFPWHFQNVHTEIHSGLNGWLEYRCPLSNCGCTYSQRRFRPNGPRSSVIYSICRESYGIVKERSKSPCGASSCISGDGIKSSHPPSANELQTDNKSHQPNSNDSNKRLLHEGTPDIFTSIDYDSPVFVGERRVPSSSNIRPALLSLPSEVLCHIACFLDSFSLGNLALTCHLLRDISSSLLQDRGMVVVTWKRVITKENKNHWITAEKVLL